MLSNTAILIIDAQYDFCNPSGALFVPGADEDMTRLARFVKKHQSNIKQIFVTLDTHQVTDISHPTFWKDAHGNFAPPFTPITLEDVKAAKWTPTCHQEKALQYLEKLEAQNAFTHFVWPEHCLDGSMGQSLDATIFEALKAWTIDQGRSYEVIRKGLYALSEHFGIFAAQVPEASVSSTLPNMDLINTLNTYDHVVVAGQAKSHCVATSIEQAMDLSPLLASKMIILEDCMSDVTGLGHLGEPIYDRAKKEGIRFEKSTDIV